MKVDSIIGGEFECVRTQLNSVSSQIEISSPYTFASGRIALYTILRYCMEILNCKKVYLPDYLCDSIIETVVATGINLDFYHVFYDLVPDYSSITKNVERGG